MKKVCRKCWRKQRGRGPCICGGDLVVARAKPDTGHDSNVLDFLEQFSERGGHWTGMTIHDSRDMGYKSGFVSVTMRELNGRGNSLREALVDLMRQAGKV